MPIPTINNPLKTVASRLEEVLLSEMLRTAKVGESQGTGEFASFLRDAEAAQIAKGGGVGIAEMIIRAMGGKE